jgi:hypothetical protein
MPSRFFYPRPEYPRPERQRGTLEGFDWLNLNGPWQFRFDGERRGVEEQWFLEEVPEWRAQIIVPFCWESLAAWGEGDAAGNNNYYSTRVFVNPLEVTRENHRSARRYEVGWYKRTVEIPQDGPWNQRRVILHVGAADFFTDCWCNGRHMGRHEGGYTPFEFDLTDALIQGDGVAKAFLVFRVEDPMDNSEQPVGKQWRWYTTSSGIWQTVYIEPRHPTHIRRFRIYTDIDAGTARFDVERMGEGNCELDIEVIAPSGQTQTSTMRLPGNEGRHEFKIDNPALWDPNTPNLYDAVLTLKRDGQPIDTVRTYFGIRKIDFELAKESGVPAALRVNNVARYLRGALYQSYHPDGVYTATRVDTLKDDIAWAKRFGFNFLRIHIKIDDPLVLYWADKLGIFIMADFPNFGEGGDTALGRQRFESMMRLAIERDFNHPSIFAWCLFNETWGFGGQDSFKEFLKAPLAQQKPEPGLAGISGQGAATEKAPTARKSAAASQPGLSAPQVWVQKMWELAKQLDPTRLVEDMSVCHWDHLEYFQHCDTDINSWHFYINDYQKAKAHIDRIVSSTFIGSTFNYVPGFKHKGQPLINSEYGGVGALDGDRDVSWSFKFLTNELRRHPQISAYIYTELHDVEWEYNGFLNYDRTPKEFGYDPRIINESNTLPVDSAPVVRLKPGGTTRLEVSSSHYSTRKYQDISLHWVMGGVDTQGRLHQDLARGRVPIPFPHRKVAHAHTLELKLPEATMLCLLRLTARTKDGTTIAENFVHFFVSPGYPPEREEIGRNLILRGAPAEWARAEWSGGTVDRQRERAEDACYGLGHGYFEWNLPLDGAPIAKARRLRLLCEASSHRVDTPQTDEDTFPTTLQMFLNDVRVYEGVLRNHPHDSQGVLSYLRGNHGAYGYPAYATAENDLLQEIAKKVTDNTLRLRCAVPAEALAQGGLTVYGAECGRLPVCPTLIVEW